MANIVFKFHIGLSQLPPKFHLITPILCVINLVNSMDCCSYLEFPKLKALALEKQDNKTQIRTKPKHRLLKRVADHPQDL
jgi:hypothetical protein